VDVVGTENVLLIIRELFKASRGTENSKVRKERTVATI